MMLFTIGIVKAQWQKVDGPNNCPFTCFAVKGDTILAGVSSSRRNRDDEGLYFSVDNGVTWKLLYKAKVKAIAIKGNTIFIASEVVLISKDNGLHWEKANDVSPESTNTTVILNNMHSVKALAISNDNIYAGSWDGRIFLSKDNGENWLPIANLQTTLFCLAANGNTIFAGTGAGSGIYREGICVSTDNGVNWTKSKSLPPVFVKTIVISDNDIYSGTTSGVFLSSNNGKDWASVGNLDKLVIGSIAISGNYIFAGSSNERAGDAYIPDNIVYLSTNKGHSWSKIKRGFSSEPSLSLNIESLLIKGNTVFAGFDLVGSNGYVGGGICKNETIIGK